MGLIVHIIIVVQPWLHAILAKFLSVAFADYSFLLLLGIYVVFAMNTKPLI